MPDVFDAAARSAVMRKVRGQNTGPEMLVRRTLHKMGYRFRLHRRNLPGRPDIVLPKHKSVVFVHGCFWHGHPGCPRADRPTSNIEFWNRKLDRNAERDYKASAALEEMGWRVLVLWECEIKTEAAVESAIEGFLDTAEGVSGPRRP